MALGTLCAVAAQSRHLEWQPALALSEPWRAWTAAFVHYSTTHRVGNLTGLALTAAFGWAAQVPLRAAIAWLLAWPLTHLSLLLMPGLLHYGGLSGVVHAGVTIVVVQVLLSGTRGQRWVALAVLVGMLGKMASESPWGDAVQYPTDWDIGIAPIGHVSGTLSGALCLLLVQCFQPRMRRTKDVVE